jgi:hypothetical protein
LLTKYSGKPHVTRFGLDRSNAVVRAHTTENCRHFHFDHERLLPLRARPLLARRTFFCGDGTGRAIGFSAPRDRSLSWRRTVQAAVLGSKAMTFRTEMPN